VKNLSELIFDRVERRPQARFGIAGTDQTLREAVDLAVHAVGDLHAAGVSSGTRVAVVGHTSTSYLLTWMALVLGGAEAALVNPDYPSELLTQMLVDLEPEAVIWLGRSPEPGVAPSAQHLDASELSEKRLRMGDGLISGPTPDPLPGLARSASDVAGYMHTSGTTGVPKFCEQTHEYFLRLGRFIADSMCLSESDTVLAPLPMFHINPLGYGVIGGLTGSSDVLGLEHFSASGFWPLVKDVSATVLILHAPPVEILKRATTTEDAAGHQVSRVFFADPDFLDTFDIALGFSAYGSTEAGGLSHIWCWRRGDRPDLAEGMSRYGGRSRHEVEWRVADSGEIFVRADRPGVLFSGYRKGAELIDPTDEDNWFPTGDLGRVDPFGNLVFIERQSESIRVKGEFVPIGYVEQRFATIDELDDVAIWRRASELVDDEIMLYITAESMPLDQIRSVSESLPKFMRPSAVARVDHIPRDTGVGKVRRRLLDQSIAREVIEL
jgi:crotonobetaine/carnitine-CoA ligase